MKTRFRGGCLVLEDGLQQADLVVEDERIVAIGEDFAEVDQVIDAEGKLIFPGFIDSHTHFGLFNGKIYTTDNFKEASLAAVAGGTTTVLDFVTQQSSLREALNQSIKAARESYCDYGFHLSPTRADEETLQEIRELRTEGYPSYKVYLAYPKLMLCDADLHKVLSTAAEVGALVGAHCENGPWIEELIQKELAQGHVHPRYHPLSRPDWTEAEAIMRFGMMAGSLGTSIYVVHLSSERGLKALRHLREAGVKVQAETCPQYLVLQDASFEKDLKESVVYLCSPPLRKAKDQQALWEGIKQGEIGFVGTDHCSFSVAQKLENYVDFSKSPMGLSGVEFRGKILLSEGKNQGLSWTQISHLLSTQAAKSFELYPQKGLLAIGSDADFVLVDPEKTWKLTSQKMVSKTDAIVYEGLEGKGEIEEVWLRGRLVYRQGVVEPARGRSVHERR